MRRSKAVKMGAMVLILAVWKFHMPPLMERKRQRQERI